MAKLTTIIEAEGKQVQVKDIEAMVKADMKARKLKGTDIGVYMSTSEMAAYYTIDGIGDPEWKVLL